MNNNIEYCVYMHKNKINDKVYIGQTKELEIRWKSKGIHYKNSSKFWNAIQKYGWDNFEHIVLFDHLTKEEADEKEIELIEKYQALDDRYGYNLRSGGSRGAIAESTKQKMREAQLGEKNSMYGHAYTDEEKAKLSQIQLERYKDPKEREKTKQAMLKYYQTPGAKEKQRQTIIKYIGKKVRCIETGEIFETVSAATQWCGLKNVSSISGCCKGKGKSAGRHPVTGERLHWEYVDKE